MSVSVQEDTADILADLNEAQREAVTAPGGPLLILAGAGSGKTRVIAYRLAHLILNQGVPPHRLLAVTFTNKAAGEMRQRIEALVGDAGRAATCGTFHSVCARWLRRDIRHLGRDSGFTIYDDDDQLRLIKRCVTEAGINQRVITPPAIRAAISRAKDELLLPDEYAAQASERPYEQAIARVYRRYQEALQEANALDFDDLLLTTLRLFDEVPEVLGYYQQRYQHVLVDEYQDTNRAQYEIVRRLGVLHRNITVVGDDDQSIYSWRGADIRNILAFEDEYADARVVKLERNYRSTKHILDSAHAVVQGLRSRKPKQLWTDKAPGDEVVICQALDEHDEASFVANEIERLVGDGRRHYRDYAVMYRMNAQSRSLEEALVRRRIPYQLVGGHKFYARREVKDLLCYLRLAYNPADEASLRRVINVPTRGIGARTLAILDDWADQRGEQPLVALLALHEAEQSDTELAHPFRGRAHSALLGFARLMADLSAAAQERSLVDLFDQVLTSTDYRAALERDVGFEERWENVLELRNVVNEYTELNAPTGLLAFLEEAALIADLDTLSGDHDAVTLMTLHSAKGLEFPVVFITGLEEDILPHSRSKESLDGLEEERRLCYVGITRAMEHLFLLHARRRALWGTPREADPSRFLDAVPDDSVKHIRTHALHSWSGDRLPRSSAAIRSWSGRISSTGWTTSRGAGSPAQTNAAPAAQPASTDPEWRRLGIRSAAELPQQGASVTPPNYQVGDRVRHGEFGEGSVVESVLNQRDEQEVRVRFDTAGVKLLLGSIAPMTKLNGE
ncbi:MAG: DNA helicase UvrD [Dehalococcoidia bacterium]|nr:DNA helicase UvrD [Dehalococcoidia bacterium]